MPHQSESTAWFALKRIEWTNHSGETCISYILLQNANGPCALIALVNVLVLTGRTFGEDNLSVHDFTFGKSEITVNSLLEFLASCLIAKNELLAQEYHERRLTTDDNDSNYEDSDICDEVHYEKDLDDVLKLLPHLVTGLNINPRFDGTFEEPNEIEKQSHDRLGKGKANITGIAKDHNKTPKSRSSRSISELSLFRAYNIDIVHGWVCDPSVKDYANIMEIGTYENLQLKLAEAHGKNMSIDDDPVIAATQNFLKINSTQLTEYGLHFLREILDPGSLSVIFHNNHFSTIYHEPITRTLYLLVTDAFLSRQTVRGGSLGVNDDNAPYTIIWESLNDIKGTYNEFYTGSFELISELNIIPTPPPTELPPSISLGRKNGEFNIDNERDFAIAKSMQEDMDSRIAHNMNSYYIAKNKKYNTKTNAPVSPITADKSKKSEVRRKNRHKLNSGGEDKKKKCVLM